MSTQQQQIKQVVDVIRKHKRFVVISHVNPEGDALGSALALAGLCRRLGKQASVANDGGIPKAFEFFPRVVPVAARPSQVPAPEVAMTVDVPILSRTGAMSKVIEQAKVSVNIDHHVSNQLFCDVNWVDPKASAVGEMIYQLYQAFKIIPSTDEALCMYVSIVTDTGSFKYMSTTPKVHKIASDLIARGISPVKVSQDLYECHSASDLRFLGEVLKGIQQVDGGKVAWVEVPHGLMKRGKPGPEIVDELVNYPRAVKTAEVAFVLRQETRDGKIRCSFRSKGRIDVNKIAKSFGGGGHMAASGCTIEGTLPQARQRVLKAVRQALK